MTFHGYQPDAVRDSLLNRSWATTATSVAEGWGCSVIEAAAWGVPCVALTAPGIDDSVLDGRTGWLVGPGQDFGHALADALAELADERRARGIAANCQAWARCFTWDRSAELLAGVLLGELGSGARAGPSAASPAATSARSRPSRPSAPSARRTRGTGCVRPTRSPNGTGRPRSCSGPATSSTPSAVLQRLGITDADGPAGRAGGPARRARRRAPARPAVRAHGRGGVVIALPGGAVR